MSKIKNILQVIFEVSLGYLAVAFAGLLIKIVIGFTEIIGSGYYPLLAILLCLILVTLLILGVYWFAYALLEKKRWKKLSIFILAISLFYLIGNLVLGSSLPLNYSILTIVLLGMNAFIAVGLFYPDVKFSWKEIGRAMKRYAKGLVSSLKKDFNDDGSFHVDRTRSDYDLRE